MTINWQAVAWLTGVATVWSGFLLGIIYWLLNRAITNVEERINAAAAAAKAAADDLQRHKDEYLRFLAQLPLDYYRREDMIRFETLTHAKLDGLAENIRQLECRRCQTKPQ